MAATFTVKQALEAIDEVLELIGEIEEDYPNSWERGSDFLEDVREKIGEVRETIESRGDVTGRQSDAIRNWSAGVQRWHPEHR